LLGGPQVESNLPLFPGAGQLGGVLKLRFARRRKTEQITVETDQVVVIRRQRVTRAWCDECRDDAEFIPLDEINRVIDAGTIAAVARSLHFGKAPDGSTVVCAKSLVIKP
jgi:hypothetical protein